MAKNKTPNDVLVVRFETAKQKENLKEMADQNRRSMNDEIIIAINERLLRHKLKLQNSIIPDA